MRVTAAPPCYLSARDCCAAVLPFACGHSLPASRTVLRPLRPRTVRARVPCMHSDVLTRVESSANSHPNRSGVVLAHALELVTLDKPSVGGVRTVDEAKAVRLAELEKRNAVEQARRRGRKARAKTKRLNEATIRLTEAIHLINRLNSLFQQPLSTADARKCTSKLVDGPHLDFHLIQPMATIVFEMAQMLPDLAAFWTAPVLPKDPEADTPVSTSQDET